MEIGKLYKTKDIPLYSRERNYNKFFWLPTNSPFMLISKSIFVKDFKHTNIPDMATLELLMPGYSQPILVSIYLTSISMYFEPLG